MIGLAFEVHDSDLRKREKLDEQHDEQITLDLMFRSIKLKTRSIRGSLDIFHYAFCHAGILTGNIIYIIRLNCGVTC